VSADFPPDGAEQPTAATTALLDLLGRRWALRILWELRNAPLPFNELKERCDAMSTSVLTQRLTDLGNAGLIERAPEGGYRLTEPGASLLARMRFFDDWAGEWAKTWTRAFRSRAGR
jgi:DNA-binding HxlR family transcriptional regulator